VKWPDAPNVLAEMVELQLVGYRANQLLVAPTVSQDVTFVTAAETELAVPTREAACSPDPTPKLVVPFEFGREAIEGIGF